RRRVDVDRARPLERTSEAGDAARPAADRNRHVHVGREPDAQSLGIVERAEGEPAWRDLNVGLTRVRAATLVLVTVLGTEERAADVAIGEAEATREAVVDDAGYDRGDLLEALRRDANLCAAFDRLVGRQSPVR